MKFQKAVPVGRQGFTLIELLVVISIIGVLSTVAISSFGNAQQKARDAKRKSDASQIRSALELVRADDPSGMYPYSGSTLCNVNDSFAQLKTCLEARGYMKTVPNDPKGGTYAFYTSAFGGSDYMLVICLENANDPKKDLTFQPICNTLYGTSRTASMTFQAP